MKSERSRGSISGWVFFGLAVALFLIQAVSLYNRGSKGESDVGVFYRTARLLDEGAGGEVYAQRDSVTGWPIAIPPVGIAFFHYASRLGPSATTLAWAAFNVLVAAGAVWALRRYFLQLGDVRLARAYPWLAGVFLGLGSGSVQVGQFSLLFVACWVFALSASLSVRPAASAFMWALPSAIKVYPVLMFATPLSQKAGRLKASLLFVVVLFALFFVLPMWMYGARAWELNGSFIQNVILDPSGRVNWMQALGTTANQSLDAVLIRYLSWYPKFHEQYTFIPTANLDLDTVRAVGHVLRIAILAITVVAVMRFRKIETGPCPLAFLLTAAVWSSTLYAVLPETRARYAVYAFLGFVPLVMLAINKSWKRKSIVAVILLLVMGFIPQQLEVWGAGYVGTFALWVANLRLLRDWRQGTAVDLSPELA